MRDFWHTVFGSGIGRRGRRSRRSCRRGKAATCPTCEFHSQGFGQPNTSRRCYKSYRVMSAVEVSHILCPLSTTHVERRCWNNRKPRGLSPLCNFHFDENKMLCIGGAISKTTKPKPHGRRRQPCRSHDDPPNLLVPPVFSLPSLMPRQQYHSALETLAMINR